MCSRHRQFALSSVPLPSRPPDEFTIRIQHQFGSKIITSVGYIGRMINNMYQAYDITSVPYRMTQGGQTFANAWAHVMLASNYASNLTAIPVQPFFEAAFGTVPGAFSPGGYCYNPRALCGL